MADVGYVAKNAVAFEVEKVAVVQQSELQTEAMRACAAGARVCALFALPGEDEAHEVFLVLADDDAGDLLVMRTKLTSGQSWKSLSMVIPSAQAFEREMHEEHGIPVVGHPWFKPLRKHPGLPVQEDAAVDRAYPFFQIKGEAIHEVGVGPVHAGIIEPGHFRFQCHGERVFAVEIHLGYQHRGVESLLRDASSARRLVVAESIAGDTAIGHALAHCTAMEALADVDVSSSSHQFRGLVLELERIANHVGDLGAICGDIGYLPGASFLGRLRGNFLNALMALSGNRHGRGFLRLGGMRTCANTKTLRALLEQIKNDELELREIIEVTMSMPSVLARFEHTGIVTNLMANDLGLVGPAARASGLSSDVRNDHPTGVYVSKSITIPTRSSGDVLARVRIRWDEIEHSLTFVKEQLAQLAEEAGKANPAPLKPCRSNLMVLSLVEGWRGEIVHVALSGEGGALRGYKVVDPSFHNWFGVAIALRNTEMSDFPLCNKSFNLSYAGHDL